jgi:hypothetical protein
MTRVMNFISQVQDEFAGFCAVCHEPSDSIIKRGFYELLCSPNYRDLWKFLYVIFPTHVSILGVV